MKTFTACPSRSTLLAATAAALLMTALAAIAPAQAQTIPTDPKPTCTVPAATFKAWFQSGNPTANGVVLPANSVTFPNTPNCSFYQWSMQMFLWLTSPAPVTYGGGGRIFDTSTFFDVSPPDQNGVRTFLPHFPGFIRRLDLRAAQPGAGGDPVVFAKDGRLLQVAPAQIGPTGRPLIRDQAGNLVEIGEARLDASRKPQFIDRLGKPIVHELAPAALEARRLQLRPSGPLLARKFIINGNPIFIDPFGNVIETEEGQAGGNGVLQARTGSLVYYISMVNDVYAYFLTGVKDNQITPGTNFPTTAADLNKIVTFANQHGRSFVDANALAIEVKSAWVEAGNLPNLSDYVTMTATIPTYDQSNTNQWTPNGQKTVTLALVGIHVVGSTAGHPEMIWATFEHFGNTPNATYTYTDTMNTLKTVAQNTTGTWLFAASGTTGPFNQPNMTYQSPNIVAASPHTISPSETLRSKSWGAAVDVSPNPLDVSATASNTEIIAINNSVSGQLINPDIRKNYFMTGSTWTIGGASPIPQPCGTTPGCEVGTSQLANTTMETFQQGPNNTVAQGSSKCFSCHVTNTTSVSHIFNGLKPLF